MTSETRKHRRRASDSDAESGGRGSDVKSREPRRAGYSDNDVRHRDRDGEKSYRRRDRSASDEKGSRRRRRHDSEDDRNHRSRRSHRRDRSASRSPGADRSGKRERRYRERSRSQDHSHSHSHHRRARSRSPPGRRPRSVSAPRSPPPRQSRGPLPSQKESFAGQLPPGEKPVEKEKPNFKPTGLLAKEANTVAGTTTVLKYHEPPEARKPSPKEQWRLYVFKKKDLLDTVYLHHRSAWLMGRDQKVTDLLLEHPSISKQHAVIQFRHIDSTNEYGDRSSKVKPYLIDLESANGTKLNGNKVEASRFIELVDQDVISFGESEREYVMMLPSAG